MANRMTLTPAQQARLDCREGRHSGTSRGVALGFVQCNLVILREPLAYEFLLYCQRNPKIGRASCRERV